MQIALIDDDSGLEHWALFYCRTRAHLPFTRASEENVSRRIGLKGIAETEIEIDKKAHVPHTHARIHAHVHKIDLHEQLYADI